MCLAIPGKILDISKKDGVRAGRVVFIKASSDENPLGTIRYLAPRFSSDYPATLTAHDIGSKDLLDATDLMAERLDVTLFMISIAARIEPITWIVENELAELSQGMQNRAGNASHA